MTVQSAPTASHKTSARCSWAKTIIAPITHSDTLWQECGARQMETLVSDSGNTMTTGNKMSYQSFSETLTAVHTLLTGILYLMIAVNL